MPYKCWCSRLPLSYSLSTVLYWSDLPRSSARYKPSPKRLPALPPAKPAVSNDANREQGIRRARLNRHNASGAGGVRSLTPVDRMSNKTSATVPWSSTASFASAERANCRGEIRTSRPFSVQSPTRGRRGLESRGTHWGGASRCRAYGRGQPGRGIALALEHLHVALHLVAGDLIFGRFAVVVDPPRSRKVQAVVRTPTSAVPARAEVLRVRVEQRPERREHVRISRIRSSQRDEKEASVILLLDLICGHAQHSKGPAPLLPVELSIAIPVVARNRLLDQPLGPCFLEAVPERDGV